MFRIINLLIGSYLRIQEAVGLVIGVVAVSAGGVCLSTTAVNTGNMDQVINF